MFKEETGRGLEPWSLWSWSPNPSPKRERVRAGLGATRTGRPCFFFFFFFFSSLSLACLEVDRTGKSGTTSVCNRNSRVPSCWFLLVCALQFQLAPFINLTARCRRRAGRSPHRRCCSPGDGLGPRSGGPRLFVIFSTSWNDSFGSRLRWRFCFICASWMDLGTAGMPRCTTQERHT